MKGKFITLYGINNIGKSTHAKRLVEKLEQKGFKAFYVKYPVYDVIPSGPFINNILRGNDSQTISEEELQLWYVVNRYQYQKEVERMTNEGFIVVAEDYSGTGIAWGIAKGLDEKWVENINSKLLKEDLAIMLEGERDKSACEARHVHEQNETLIEKCTFVHSQLADKYGWRRVQLQKNVEDTAKLIWDIVDDFLS
jgi:thymidylate kinase